MCTSMRTSVKCNNCGHISFTINNQHTSMQLDIPMGIESPVDLDTCIKKHSSVETVVCTCNSCKHQGKCEKAINIISSKEILVFHMKR